jgi:hypothetical protein
MDDLGVPHVWKPPYQLDTLHLDSAGFFSWQTSSLAPSFPPLNKGWWSSLSRYVQILVQQTIWWIYRLYLVRILCIYLMLYNIIHDIFLYVFTVYVQHMYIYIRSIHTYIYIYIPGIGPDQGYLVIISPGATLDSDVWDSSFNAWAGAGFQPKYGDFTWFSH